MKTLVVVITHSAARPILDMNWPWLLKSGCDIAVVDHKVEVPPSAGYWNVYPCAIATTAKLFLNIGGPPESTTNRWLDRFLEVLKWCNTSLAAQEYHNFLLCESDCIFTSPIPDVISGISAKLAGHSSEGFLASHFYHCPWIFSYDAACEFLRRAHVMISKGLTEQGFIDRFLGLYSELYGVTLQQMNTYSRNTIDLDDVPAVRQAIAEGVFFIHGVKDKEVLRQITEGL